MLKALVRRARIHPLFAALFFCASLSSACFKRECNSQGVIITGKVTITEAGESIEAPIHTELPDRGTERFVHSPSRVEPGRLCFYLESGPGTFGGLQIHLPMPASAGDEFRVAPEEEICSPFFQQEDNVVAPSVGIRMDSDLIAAEQDFEGYLRVASTDPFLLQLALYVRREDRPARSYEGWMKLTEIEDCP